MPLKIAIQMDPIAAINYASDTSLLLGAEACRRGHELYYYHPEALSFREGRLTAQGWPAVFRLEENNYYTLGDKQVLDIAEMDVVLLRQDPPFNMAYITTTYLLESVHPKTLVVNDPFHVRNAPEKWLVQQYPDLTPPTLISRDTAEFVRFWADHKDIVLKPFYGHGGNSVMRFAPGDNNFYSFLEFYLGEFNDPLIAQPFLKEVAGEEKRIVIIDGKIAPVMNRIPPAGEIRSNFRIGGTGRKIELTSKQRTAVERIIPELQKRGLLLVGLDMIGDWVTEINVTSPTGLRWINQTYDVQLEQWFWDAVEGKVGK